MNSPNPPKGSLEDLFRHHLLESEAAAVPPRPHVWEQLDNSLLLAQNEKYRRRLHIHRWAVAASLLLAVLAGGGWWRSQQQAPTSSLAQAPSQGAEAPDVARPPGSSGRLAGTAALRAGAQTAAGAVSSPTNLPAIARRATSSFSASSNNLAASAHHPVLAVVAGRAADQLARQPLTGRRAVSAPGAADGFATAVALATPDELAAGAGPQAAAEALPTRPVLALAGLSRLPGSLRALPLAEQPPLALARHWQFGLAYAASAYQPNIDFAKEASDYGIASALATKAAAAEYRNHLRAGLGQRLTLWATRRLGNGRWGLRTGLELAQNQARSASTVAFVGEPVFDLYAVRPTPALLQNTSYRYRSASVPVELRYGNPAKAGFSFYSRVGGLLTALLNVRSEVDGNAEAARTYTLMSANSPYRHLSASVRGGLGMQYRPTSHQWALSLGPVAEAGVLSLNATPTQDFWSQQRPYSFGLEAGVELGRTPRLP